MSCCWILRDCEVTSRVLFFFSTVYIFLVLQRIGVVFCIKNMNFKTRFSRINQYDASLIKLLKSSSRLTEKLWTISHGSSINTLHKAERMADRMRECSSVFIWKEEQGCIRLCLVYGVERGGISSC